MNISRNLGGGSVCMGGIGLYMHTCEYLQIINNQAIGISGHYKHKCTEKFVPRTAAESR